MYIRVVQEFKIRIFKGATTTNCETIRKYNFCSLIYDPRALNSNISPSIDIRFFLATLGLFSIFTNAFLNLVLT